MTGTETWGGRVYRKAFQTIVTTGLTARARGLLKKAIFQDQLWFSAICSGGVFGMACRLIALPRMLAVVGVFFAAWVCCCQRPANSQEVASLGEDNGPPPRRRLSSTEQALLDSAGVQYGAYGELLLVFSDGGRLPIFHERVDLSDDDPQKAIDPDNGTSKTVFYDDHFQPVPTDPLVETDNNRVPGSSLRPTARSRSA